jgi:agmatinase
MKEALSNFLGLPMKYSNYKTSKFVIIPIPYEKTTTYMKGTKFAPQAILDASRHLELYDEELDSVTAEAGIATLNPVSIKDPPEKMVERVKSVCLEVLKDNKFPIVLGGEHSISYGFLLAVKEFYNKVTVLQLDAHADLRNSFEGTKYNHACVIRRMREHADVVQVGIRSLSKAEADLIKKGNYKVFFAKDLIKRDYRKEIVKTLERNVFITIDVDVFDPGLIPSVGTPEPGGLEWYEVLDLLKAVIKEKNIVGFDVVELCPNPVNKTPDFIVAKFIYKIIGYISNKKE